MADRVQEHFKSKRGFASMSLEQRRSISSLGGRSLPAHKRSFATQRDLASEAGRKGGLSSGRIRSERGRSS